MARYQGSYDTDIVGNKVKGVLTVDTGSLVKDNTGIYCSITTRIGFYQNNQSYIGYAYNGTGNIFYYFNGMQSTIRGVLFNFHFTDYHQYIGDYGVTTHKHYLGNGRNSKISVRCNIDMPTYNGYNYQFDNVDNLLFITTPTIPNGSVKATVTSTTQTTATFEVTISNNSLGYWRAYLYDGDARKGALNDGKNTITGLTPYTSYSRYNIRLVGKDNSVLAGPYLSFITKKIAVASVTISPPSVHLKAGDTQQFTAKVEPANASVQNITWNVSAPAVASINQSGTLTAIGGGETSVTATADGVAGTAAVSVALPYQNKAKVNDQNALKLYNTVINDGGVVKRNLDMVANSGGVILKSKN